MNALGQLIRALASLLIQSASTRFATRSLACYEVMFYLILPFITTSPVTFSSGYRSQLIMPSMVKVFNCFAFSATKHVTNQSTWFTSWNEFASAYCVITVLERLIDPTEHAYKHTRVLICNMPTTGHQQHRNSTSHKLTCCVNKHSLTYIHLR